MNELNFFGEPKKGITSSEYKDLLDYIQLNNGWENMYERHCNAKDNNNEDSFVRTPLVKYSNASYDTRDGRIWRVGFQAGERESFVFTDNNGYDMLGMIYLWLKGGNFCGSRGSD